MTIQIPCRIMLRKTALLMCLLLLALSVAITPAQEGKRRNQMRMRQSEPNVLAPELYLEHLRLKITLVDLPGASDPRSNWEGNYQLYFVSEVEHEKALKELVKGRSERGAVAVDLSLSTFPNKILLAEGNFKKSGLATLRDRTFILEKIAFRSKVPDAERTKEARLLLSCNVKIYDAQLKQTIYRTRLWNAQAPLMEDAANPEKDVARTTMYSNFYLTKTGDVYESQWTREGESTSWH